MEFQEFRPIFSGLVGGLIAIGFGIWWKRRQPAELRREREVIFENHKIVVYVASFLVFAGLIAGLLLAKFGGFEANSWTPFGLGVGGGCAAAMLALVIFPLVMGQSIKQAFIAMAESEGGPPFLVFSILGLGVVGLLFALGALLKQ